VLECARCCLSGANSLFDPGPNACIDGILLKACIDGILLKACIDGILLKESGSRALLESLPVSLLTTGSSVDQFPKSR